MRATTTSGPVRASRGGCVGLVLVAAFAIGCSNESTTGPTRQERQALAVKLDAARNASRDSGRVEMLNGMLQILALGGPVDSVTVSVNGVAATYPALTGTFIQAVGGVPSESLYVAFAWHGDPVDTVFEFAIVNFGPAIAGFQIAPSDTSFGASPSAITYQFSASPAAGSCASLLTQVPADVYVPPEVQCQRQTVSASMVAPLQFTNAPTVTISLPQQSVRSVRLVVNAP